MILGIIAIEQLLKMELIDWSKVRPKKYKADMTEVGFEVDIITCEYGKFPVIEKISNRPAIIAIKKDEKSIWICGFASVDVLLENQNETYLKETMQRETKTAFVGFDKLEPFTNADELRELIQVTNEVKTN